MTGSAVGVETSADAVLVTAMRTFVGISVRASDELGPVSLVQLRALTVLDEDDGANLLQLSEGMGVTVSTTSRLVDRLVAAELVDRRPSEVTRREISLRLTEAGRDLVAHYDRLRLEAVHQRLDQLPEDRGVERVGRRRKEARGVGVRVGREGGLERVHAVGQLGRERREGVGDHGGPGRWGAGVRWERGGSYRGKPGGGLRPATGGKAGNTNTRLPIHQSGGAPYPGLPCVRPGREG